MIRTRTGGFDVVVVGAGPAGCAAAARLSEDERCEVLLLDEGPDWRIADAPAEMSRPSWVAYRDDIPSLAKFHRDDLAVIRTDGAEPMPYFAGRGVGGSSTINAQIALRPPLDQFDRWAEEGAKGWSADYAREGFARNEADRDFGLRNGHGQAGPVSIERTPRPAWSALENAFFDACAGTGAALLDDLNGAGEDGVGPLPYARRDGARVTANHAYIEPHRDRPNLTVRGGSRVDRILLSGGRATGVLCAGPDREIHADQVLLCAGTVSSAALLMRSGVGPAADLRPLGIEVEIDLPVGRHVLDHPIFDLSIDWRCDGDPPIEDRPIANCALRYSSGVEGSGPGDMLLLPLSQVSFLGIDFPERIGVWLMEAFSRGSIKLREKGGLLAPMIELALWGDERDLDRIAQGVEKACALLDGPSFGERGGRCRTIGHLGEPIADPTDRAATRAMLREHAANQAHISSSCPIGPAGSERGVVDPEGRVHGLERLRVGDLSIAPTCPRAGPYLTAGLLGDAIAGRLASVT